MKDTLNKAFYLVLGIVIGLLIYLSFALYPASRKGIQLIGALGILFIALLGEKYRGQEQANRKLKEISKNIEKIRQGNREICFPEEESQAVNEVYKAAEELRKHLKRKNRIQSAVLDIINILTVNIELDSLIEVLLPRLVEETSSSWGVFYTYNKHTNKMELKRSVGLSKNVYKEFDVEIGEGFIGQAAMTKEIRILKDIPSDTIFENRTFLGKVIPRNIMTVPVMSQNKLVAVFAFAGIYAYNDEQISVMEILRNYMGFAFKNCMTYERTQRLTKELQFQNELIQNMNDDLEKKVEERTDFLNRIINNIKDYFIVSLDKDGYVTTWNSGAERLRGYSAQETIGRHLTDFYITEEDRQEVRDNLSSALREGRFAECGWRTSRDGTRYFADVLVTPMYGEEGQLQGYTIITKDITDMKNLERALLYEKAYNEKIIENSNRAVLVTDKDGVILNANEMTGELLAPKGTKIVGRGFSEFFVDSEEVETNIRSICSLSTKMEIVRELLYKHNGIEWLTINAVATATQDENIGALIYITKAER